MKKYPSRERLRELLDYDPKTGILLFKKRNKRKWDAQFAGKTAGGLTNTHEEVFIHRLKLFNVTYHTSRIIYIWMTGECPEVVETKDHNPANMIWTNLVPSNKLQNSRKHKISKNNRTGVTGTAQKANGRYIAYIGTNIRLGTFDTLEEAAKARRQAEARLNYNCQ